MAGITHFVGSWVPIDGHPVIRVEGCRPQVRELRLGGVGWSRESGIPPSLLAQSQNPLIWRSQKAPAIGVQGLYHFTLSHKPQTHTVFPGSLVPAGSPRDLSCLVISPAETPQPLVWPIGPALLPALCRLVGL